jgi:hypothetical protein
MVADESLKFMKYIFWSRILSENMIFRNMWKPLKKICNMMFFDIICSFADYIIKESGNEFLKSLTVQLDLQDKIPDALNYIYDNTDEFKKTVISWWNEMGSKDIEENTREFLRELILYDLITLPIKNIAADRCLIINTGKYFIRKNVHFNFDIKNVLASEKCKKIIRKAVDYDILYKHGFNNYMFNQEFIPYYIGVVKYSDGCDIS